MNGTTLFKIHFILFALLLGLQPLCNAQTGTFVTETEAEDGTFSGNVSKGSSISGYSGSGYATNFMNGGDKITVKVNVPKKAFYSIFIQYHSESYKEQDISINEGSSSAVQFKSSGSEFALANGGKHLLNEGENSITIISGWGWIDIDKFMIYTTALNNYDNIAAELIDPKADGATKALYYYLLSNYGKRIITGQTNDHYDKVVNITEKSPMHRAWDFMGYTEGYPYLWANGGHSFGKNTADKSTENAIVWYEKTGRKGIVGFHWHWHSPSGGVVGKNNFYTENTTFDIRRAVTEGTEEYKLIIRDIDEIAVELKKLQAAGVPILWRPLHEAGGGWFWWGANGAEPCKKMWNIMYDRLSNYHQIHNLIWVWSSNEKDWYPGNDKVDIVGYDSYPGSYNYGNQKNTFDICHNLTDGKKIITMSENGPIPDINESLDLDAPWSYFMSWNDLVEAQNSKEHIKNVFCDPRSLTLETDTFPRIIYTKEASICGSGSVTLEAKSNFGTVKWYETEIGGEAFHTGESFTTPMLESSKTYYVDSEYNNHPSGMKRIAVKVSLAKEIGDLIIDGPVDPCQGETAVAYTAISTDEVNSYNWTLSSELSGKSVSSTIYIDVKSETEKATLSVSAENACGNSNPAILEIIPKQLPKSLGEIVGAETFCEGSENVEFKIAHSNDVSSYKWTLPKGATGSSTGNTIAVNFGTTFTSGEILVQGINGCGEGQISSLPVAIKKIPSAPSTITGTFTVCQKEEGITYNAANISSASSYVWTLPEGAEGNSNTKSITVNFSPDAKSGKISVQGENECGIGKAKSITITVNPTPETPCISTSDNGFLVSSASTGNQWYANEIAIENAVNDTLQPTGNADYSTIVTMKGCSSEPSNKITFTNVEAMDISNLSIYPNPIAYGTTTLHINRFIGKNWKSAQLINANGQIVGKATINGQSIEFEDVIDKGIYFLSILEHDELFLSKLIVK